MANLISKTSDEYSVSVSDEDESDQDVISKVRHDMSLDAEYRHDMTLDGDDDAEYVDNGDVDVDAVSVDSNLSEEEEMKAKSKKKAKKMVNDVKMKKVRESATTIPTKSDQLVAPADVGDFDLSDQPLYAASKIKPKLPSNPKAPPNNDLKTPPMSKSRSKSKNEEKVVTQDVATTKAMTDLENHMLKHKAQHHEHVPAKEEEVGESKATPKRTHEKRKTPPAKPQSTAPTPSKSKKRKTVDEMTERGKAAAAAMQRRSNTRAVRVAVGTFCTKKAKIFKSQQDAESTLVRAPDLKAFKLELPWWIHHAPEELKKIFPDPFNTVPNYSAWTKEDKKTFAPLRGAPGFQSFVHGVCLDHTTPFGFPHFSEFQTPDSDGLDF
jgi:hypothetical protein